MGCLIACSIKENSPFFDSNSWTFFSVIVADKVVRMSESSMIQPAISLNLLLFWFLMRLIINGLVSIFARDMPSSANFTNNGKWGHKCLTDRCADPNVALVGM